MPLLSDGDPAGVAGLSGRMVLGRYRIEKQLGQGGMGQVLLALDTLLNRRVALKRLLSIGLDRTNLRNAILREARRASQINDRHIAAIYDVLDLDDEVILVMEYVDGVTLRQRMTEPMALEVFWDLATQCVEGVAAAHAHGVVHRDIKPDNLMITSNGHVKILDFGIAKRTRPADGMSTTHTTESQTVAGTPQYMAPEAHLGGRVDERTDIFSLGAVFYEMLTARRPFEGVTYAMVVDRVLNSEPTPVFELNPRVGADLSAVVTRMLAKDPANRFATPVDLMEHLIRARGEAVHTRVLALPRSGAQASRGARTRAAWAYPAVSVLSVCALSFGWWWRTAALPALPKDQNLAVLAPKVAGAGDFASMALGMTELLSKRLQKHTDASNFQLASFEDGIDKKVQEPADARRILGANLALVPTLTQETDVLRARLDLVDTIHGRLVTSRKVEVPATQPFVFLDRTYDAATAMLRAKRHGASASAEYGIHGAGTLRFYLQGLGRLRAARTADDARKAVGDFEVACRTQPDAAESRAGLALAQKKVHELTAEPDWLTRAERSAREAVALDSARAGPHRVLGYVLLGQRNNTGAVREFDRASRLDPTDDWSRYRLGRTWFRMGQPEREKALYLAAIEQRPHCYQPYWWLANWYYRESNFNESIRLFEEMVRRSPEFYQGYSNLGGLLVLRGDYGRGIDTLKRSLDLLPTNGAFDNLGTAYFNSGRFQDAVDAYNQAFQFGVADYDTWVNLGDAYLWLRDRKVDAADAYLQGIRLGREQLLVQAKQGKPLNAMAAASMATVFARLGQPDSARVYLARAVSADSTNSIVDYCAALTHWQLGEKDLAVSWLEKSVHGGYPTKWLRDSPIFREWRTEPKFRALIGEATPQQAAARN